MSTVATVLRTELSAQARTVQPFLLVAAAVLALNVAMGGASLSVTIAMVTVAFLPANLFGQEEKSNQSTMYLLLPVRRRQVVLARYLLVGLLMVVMMVVGFGLAVALRPLAEPQEQLTLAATVSMMGLAFAFLSLVLGLQMPMLFRLGAARGGVYTMAVPMVALFGTMILLHQVPSLLPALLRLMSTPLTGVVGILAGCAVQVVSVLVATRLYEQRDL
ncbi:MAG: ABC-2 transporter permease [Actinomycetia bacterium]|nr:ABC-2 transporter permease [Actinomycetes bacterium]